MQNAADLQQGLLGPIVTQWLSRLQAAERAKERFSTIAKICRQFYGSSARAMWEDEFRAQFFPKVSSPQFMISLNKAFEQVAVIGPSLYWDNPERTVRSPERPDQVMIAQLLGVQDREMLQQVGASQQQDDLMREARNQLASLVLKHTASEQSLTLKNDCHQAIDELMMTGLGLMWPTVYTHHATGETLTANRFGCNDDLLIDPDSKNPDWSDAKWISRTWFEPVYQVERRFGLPPGYLAGRGTTVSAEYQATRPNDGMAHGDRYCDMMTWTEIWSVGGIGSRISSVDGKLSQFLDQVVGDFAYLAITPNVPHPLNVPPVVMQQGSVEQLKAAVQWRTTGFGAVHEVWKDRRWPCEPLISYRVPRSPWPLAPLAPGLGYLICMNLIMVSKLTQSWERRREIFGVAEEMVSKAQDALAKDDPVVFLPLAHEIGKPMSEIVQRLERGDTSDDLLEWMNYLSNEFQKSTGLLDIHYGITQTQARVSGDIDAKSRAAGIRPEKMRSDIKAWVQRFSTSELWLLAQHVKGEQLVPLLGTFGAMAWDMLIGSIPFDHLVREMHCTIDVKDLQRPDYARDLDGLQEIAQPFTQAAAAYAAQTGDPSPLNEFFRRWAIAMDMRDPEKFQFGPWMPQPDPAMQQMQQQAAQLELQQTAAQLAETQAKTIGRLTDTQFKMRGVTPQMLTAMQYDRMKFEQQMQQDQVKHLQNLLQDEELFQIMVKKARAQVQQRRAG